jgi:hypothetical protein
VRAAILELQERTRGGAVAKEDEANFKRSISRLENSLQMSRIKLSVAHSDNVSSRTQIDALRQDKAMYLQIQRGIVSYILYNTQYIDYITIIKF